MIFSKIRQRRQHKKIVNHFGEVFHSLRCNILYVPVFSDHKAQHPLAMILDGHVNHFLAQALRSKRFTGHLTEHLWYIPQKLEGIDNICFFGVGPKKRLNLTIFQSILNQVTQIKGFTAKPLPGSDQEKQSKNFYVIMPNITGQKNRLLKLK